MKLSLLFMMAVATAQNSPEPEVEKIWTDYQKLPRVESLVKKIRDEIPALTKSIEQAADAAARTEAPGMLALVDASEGVSQWWYGRSISWPRFKRLAIDGYLVQLSSDGEVMCGVNQYHHIWCQQVGKNNWWRVWGTPNTLISHVLVHNGKLLAQRATDKRGLVLEDVKNPNSAWIEKWVSNPANSGYNGHVFALPTSTVINFMPWENLQGDVKGKYKKVNMAGVCAAVGTGNQGYVIVPGGALEYWPNPLASLTNHSKTPGPPGGIVLTELRAKRRHLCGTNGSQLWCQLLKKDGAPTGQWKNMNIKAKSFTFH